MVVALNPAIDRVLRGGDRLERGDVIEELLPEGLVEPLDLPGSSWVSEAWSTVG